MTTGPSDLAASLQAERQSFQRYRKEAEREQEALRKFVSRLEEETRALNGQHQQNLCSQISLLKRKQQREYNEQVAALRRKFEHAQDEQTAEHSRALQELQRQHQKDLAFERRQRGVVMGAVQDLEATVRALEEDLAEEAHNAALARELLCMEQSRAQHYCHQAALLQQQFKKSKHELEKLHCVLQSTQLDYQRKVELLKRQCLEALANQKRAEMRLEFISRVTTMRKTCSGCCTQSQCSVPSPSVQLARPTIETLCHETEGVRHSGDSLQCGGGSSLRSPQLSTYLVPDTAEPFPSPAGVRTTDQHFSATNADPQPLGEFYAQVQVSAHSDVVIEWLSAQTPRSTGVPLALSNAEGPLPVTVCNEHSLGSALSGQSVDSVRSSLDWEMEWETQPSAEDLLVQEDVLWGQLENDAQRLDTMLEAVTTTPQGALLGRCSTERCTAGGWSGSDSGLGDAALLPHSDAEEKPQDWPEFLPILERVPELDLELGHCKEDLDVAWDLLTKVQKALVLQPHSATLQSQENALVADVEQAQMKVWDREEELRSAECAILKHISPSAPMAGDSPHPFLQMRAPRTRALNLPPSPASGGDWEGKECSPSGMDREVEQIPRLSPTWEGGAPSSSPSDDIPGASSPPLHDDLD